MDRFGLRVIKIIDSLRIKIRVVGRICGLINDGPARLGLDRRASSYSKVRDVTPWDASPRFSISHYITVSVPSSEARGRGLMIPNALGTCRASGNPAEVPDRGFCPSRWNVTDRRERFDRSRR